MKSLFSFSASDLFSRCTYPFAEDVTWEREEPGEEALWGLAWHELQERPKLKESDAGAIAKKWGIPDPKELLESVAAGRKILDRWLQEEGFLKGSSKVFRERSIAYDPTTDRARFISGPTPEDHLYLDRRPNEFCGTLDLGIVADSSLLILDYKTGFDTPDPQNAGQLLSGALGLRAAVTHRRGNRRKFTLAYLHAPRGTIPTIYPTEVGQGALTSWRMKLLTQLDRVGDGSMTPGAHCKGLYCPFRFACPTRDAELLDNARALVPLASSQMARGLESLTVANDSELSRAEKFGELHETLETYDLLRERLREEMCKELLELGHFVRPRDGLLVVPQKVIKERISKGSIERALGRLQGAREIERLRKMGCLETKEEMHMKKKQDI